LAKKAKSIADKASSLGFGWLGVAVVELLILSGNWPFTVYPPPPPKLCFFGKPNQKHSNDERKKGTIRTIGSLGRFFWWEIPCKSSLGVSWMSFGWFVNGLFFYGWG